MKQSPEMKLAVKAALTAGKISRKLFLKEIAVRSKGPKDVVTEADFACEKKIREIVSKKFPSDGFLGEEFGRSGKGTDREWIIDPIDGTTNFVFGFPFFCTSIAFVEKGEVRAGVVFNPFYNEMFSAEKGKGSFLNGKMISVTRRKRLIDSMIIVGYPQQEPEFMEKSYEINKDLAKNTERVRMTGSAALEICFVAAGRADGFAEIRLHPWDFAAGKLIVEEAGGKTSTFAGKKLNFTESQSFAASNSFIHGELLSHLKV